MTHPGSARTTRRRIGSVLLALFVVLVGLPGPAAAQSESPATVVGASTTGPPTTASPTTGTAPEVVDVPVAPPGSEAIDPGPRLTTEDDGEGAPTFLIVGVAVSALATVLVLVFFIRSRRPADS
jgi:hypothetical protein